MEFKFSVVMPLYNAAAYLEEAVQCILDQTLGFGDSIQIVFVNDGSTDETDRICSEFVRSWPDNIIYIEKENGGVSSTRNRGIEAAEGKYVVFFDYDDLWEEDAFERIFAFCEAHSAVDVITCKMKFIGDYEGKVHPLDYKFREGSREVDLLEEPNYVNSTIGNMVFRREAIGAHRYDPDLPTGEDATFTNTILLNNPKLGIITDAVFYYRRNNQTGSVSSSAPDRKTWYFEVPEKYYLRLIEESKKRFGETVAFIQEVILYDMRWRHYNEKMMTVLSEEEKERHIDIMHRVLMEVDDERIADYQIIAQYRRLYYLYLKHGEKLKESCTFSKGWAYFGDKKILNYYARSMLQIVTIHVRNGELVIDGFHRLHNLLTDLELQIRDEQGTVYSYEMFPYPEAEQRGYIGEMAAYGTRFRVRIPIRGEMKIAFFVNIGDQEWKMKPDLWTESGLERKKRYTFTVLDSWILRYQSHRICVLPYTDQMYRYLKRRYLLSALYHRDKKRYKRMRNRLELQEIMRKTEPKNQVAFITARSNDGLLPNLKAVYDGWNGEKVSFAGMAPYDQSTLKRLAKVFYQSKVVVTDDYLYILRIFGKRPDQSVIQIWHAAGAFKRFGGDGTNMFPSIDEAYHRDYDVVSVSSDTIRPIYAKAFGIPEENVKAFGVPRTDKMFETGYADEVRSKVFEQHPELSGKQVILYAPTFRDGNGQNKRSFSPQLDFTQLSRTLRPDQVFVICPHPVMKNEIIEEEYDNLFVIRDISTNEMMYVADLLVTDYSSVIFEFAILKKPMLFYCYDYDEYNRDFYLDYEHDLPGRLLRTEEELFAALSEGSFSVDERIEQFYQKYMNACDGNSTKRLTDEIRACLDL